MITAKEAIAKAKGGGSRKRYRVGLAPNTPFFFLTVGGVTFPRMTRVFTDPSGDTYRDEQGSVVHLTDEEKKRVTEAAQFKLIRTVKKADGQPVRSVTLDTRSIGFAALPDDLPLADFLTIVEEPENAAKVSTIAELVKAEKAEKAELEKIEVEEDSARSKPDDAQVRAKNSRAKREGAAVSADPQ